VAKFFGLPLSIIAAAHFLFLNQTNTALSIMPRSAKEQLAERGNEPQFCRSSLHTSDLCSSSTKFDSFQSFYFLSLLTVANPVLVPSLLMPLPT